MTALPRNGQKPELARTRSSGLLRVIPGPFLRRPDALAALADAAVAGDRAAVRTFILTVGPSLLRVARRVLGPGHADIDDVAQECTVAVLDALPGRRGASTVMHFACRVAVLTAMKVRRREAALKRRSIRDDEVRVEMLPSGVPTPEAELSARGSASVVRELLDLLPMEQAEVLALHCILGYTVPEIAEAGQIPSETVRSRLRLSKCALRARILQDTRLIELVRESL